MSTGIDEYDLLLLNESQELSHLLKRNPVFREFDEVRKIERTADIILRDALIWRVPDNLFLQHYSSLDSVAEYQAIHSHINSE